MNRDKTLKYLSFTVGKRSWKGILSVIINVNIIFWVMIIMITFTGKVGPAILVCAVILVGELMLAKALKGYTDTQYDEVVLAENKDVVGQVLVKNNMENTNVVSGEVVLIDGYNFEKLNYARFGNDKVWRSDMFQSCVICYTEDTIKFFNRIFSTVKVGCEEFTDEICIEYILECKLRKNARAHGTNTIEYDEIYISTRQGKEVKIPVRDIQKANAVIDTINNRRKKYVM